MWRMYNKKCDSQLKVTKWFFTNIFSTEYNLGFGTPRVDTCSACSELKTRIKNTKDLQAREKIILKLNIHCQRADAYFDKLREESNDLVTLSFDCEKNQALPKLSDQAAYYRRQLNFYNFTIVKGSSHNTLNKENIDSHYWIEGEQSKGSNEIASALYFSLNNLRMSSNIKRVRLCCDGCPEQNKNTVMIGMISYWLHNKAPPHIQTVELDFPVTGHSFIPPDRVFGTIEKVINKEILLSPKSMWRSLKSILQFST